MPIEVAASTRYTADVITIHENSFYHDAFNQPPKGVEEYLLPAVVTVQKGKSVSVKYPGPAVVLVLEGEVQVEDTAKPGQVNKLSAGDVIRIDKATATTWSSASQGKCLGVALLEKSVRSKDILV